MCTQTSVDVHDRKQKPRLISFNTEFELIVVKKKKKKSHGPKGRDTLGRLLKVCSTAEETEEGLGEIHHHITGNDVSRIVFGLKTTTSLDIVALIALDADAPMDTWTR